MYCAYTSRSGGFVVNWREEGQLIQGDCMSRTSLMTSLYCSELVGGLHFVDILTGTLTTHRFQCLLQHIVFI